MANQMKEPTKKLKRDMICLLITTSSLSMRQKLLF